MEGRGMIRFGLILLGAPKTLGGRPTPTLQGPGSRVCSAAAWRKHPGSGYPQVVQTYCVHHLTYRGLKQEKSLAFNIPEWWSQQAYKIRMKSGHNRQYNLDTSGGKQSLGGVLDMGVIEWYGGCGVLGGLIA